LAELITFGFFSPGSIIDMFRFPDDEDEGELFGYINDTGAFELLVRVDAEI
jgi:hypothetical protein